MRSQFTFYESFAAGIKRIRNKAARCDAYDAIVMYALYGIESDLDKIPDTAAMAFLYAKPVLDAAAKKSDGGKKCTRVDEDADKIPASTDEDSDNKKKNKKESKIENKIENECYSPPVSPSRFKPPTVDEVKAYCAERKNYVDAEHFVSHYEANGWKVGKNPMKDWKAAVRTWEAEDKKRNEVGRKYQPGTQPGGADRPGPTKDDVERMKRFLASMKEEDSA
jgi:hypothetical protein